MFYLAGCMLLGVFASLWTWELSLLLFDELEDDERGEPDVDEELEEIVLLEAEEVLTFEEERGELEDDELDDIVLLLEEDCEELLL